MKQALLHPIYVPINPTPETHINEKPDYDNEDSYDDDDDTFK